MMQTRSESRPAIEARVESVLPRLGLAFVSDGKQDWGVTRTALGERFEALSPGVRVRLQLHQHRGSSLVLDCQASIVAGHLMDLSPLLGRLKTESRDFR